MGSGVGSGTGVGVGSGAGTGAGWVSAVKSVAALPSMKLSMKSTPVWMVPGRRYIPVRM